MFDVLKIERHIRLERRIAPCGHLPEPRNAGLYVQPPVVLHHRNDRPGVMRPGMTFTIEPMLTLGTIAYDVWPDRWTAVTRDGKRTAQFEHTLLVTSDGYEILTVE